MRTTSFYTGLVKRELNKSSIANLKENILGAFFTAKKNRLEFLNDVLSMDEKQLSQYQEKLTKASVTFQASIADYERSIKKSEEELEALDKEIRSINLSKLDEDHLKELMTLQNVQIFERELKKIEEESKDSKNQDKLRKLQCLLKRKEFGRIPATKKELRNKKILKKTNEDELNEINQLMRSNDYKPRLIEEQKKLQQDAKNIEVQDKDVIHRAGEFKVAQINLTRELKTLETFHFSAQTPKAKQEELKTRNEMEQNLNDALDRLQQKVKESEKLYYEMGLTDDQIPHSVRLEWQRAIFAEKLLDGELNPKYRVEIRAGNILKKLELAKLFSVEINFEGKPQNLYKLLQGTLIEYENLLKEQKVSDVKSLEATYQKLSNVCEYCFSPLYNSLTEEENWLKEISEGDTLSPNEQAWSRLDNELNAKIVKESDISNSIRNFYIFQKLAEIDKKSWATKFEAVKENLNAVKGQYGFSVQILLESFSEHDIVNQTVLILKDPVRLAEPIVQYEIIMNQVIELGESSLITQLRSAFATLIRSKNSIENQDLFAIGIFDFLMVMAQCKEKINHPSNQSKLKNLFEKASRGGADKKEEKGEVKEVKTEVKPLSLSSKLKEATGASLLTNTILQSIASEYKKSPSDVPFSKQADYLITKIQSLNAQKIKEDKKAIDLIGNYYPEHAKSKAEPEKLLEEILRNISKNLKNAEQSFLWRLFGYKTQAHVQAINSLATARAVTISFINRYCSLRIREEEPLPRHLISPIEIKEVVTPLAKKTKEAGTPEEKEPLIPKPVPETKKGFFARIKDWWSGKPKELVVVASLKKLDASKNAETKKDIPVPNSSTSLLKMASNKILAKTAEIKESKRKPKPKSKSDEETVPLLKDYHDSKPLQEEHHPFFNGVESSVYKIKEESRSYPMDQFETFTKRETSLSSASLEIKGDAAPAVLNENSFQGHSFKDNLNHEIKWVDRLDEKDKTKVISEVWVIPDSMRLENIFKKCVHDTYRNVDDQVSFMLEQCAKHLTHNTKSLITKDNLINVLNKHKSIIADMTPNKGRAFLLSSKIDRLATELLAAYKAASEQSYHVPYLDKDKKVMRHAGCTLPSDVFLTLAMRELNSLEDTQKHVNEPTLTISNAWDPAYVKSIKLTCELRNKYNTKKIHCVNRTGYPVPDVTSEELIAFEWLLTEKAGEKKDLEVLKTKLATHKDIPSPFAEVTTLPESLFKIKK